MNIRSSASLLCLALLTTVVGGTASAQSSFRNASSAEVSYTRTPHRAALACETLRQWTNYDYSVVTAQVIAAKDGIPEHCRIEGVIDPEVQFQVNLPADWNGRLYMYGNGGYAGQSLNHPYFSRDRDKALRHGFATAYTDTGHDEAAEPGLSFAQNNLVKALDYNYRAVHLTIVTAKELTKAFYRRAARYSYFEGCSTGGRQGLMSAQRFPADFDGILASAPLVDVSGTLYWAAATVGAFGATKLSPEKVAEVVAPAIYAKCDALDGAQDGLIADPRRCDFQPQRDLPICESGKNQKSCMTPAEIALLQRLYSGLERDGQIVYPGLPIGAEAPGAPELWWRSKDRRLTGWRPWVLEADGGPGRRFAGLDSFFRYMAFPQDDPQFNWREADLTALYPRSEHLRNGVLDATYPDLSAFRQRGGKMITFHGWSDVAANPLATTRYYDTVIGKMGEAAARDVYRVFMVPGMFHCANGFGTDVFDAMSELVTWVERGKAPARILAEQIEDGKVIRTRPLCAYPESARYVGSGSLDDGANFSCQRVDP